MHPPRIVYVVLAVISVGSAFLLGYEIGATEVASGSHMIVLLALILPFTFYVILDFDYLRLGLIGLTTSIT